MFFFFLIKIIIISVGLYFKAIWYQTFLACTQYSKKKNWATLRERALLHYLSTSKFKKRESALLYYLSTSKFKKREKKLERERREKKKKKKKRSSWRRMVHCCTGFPWSFFILFFGLPKPGVLLGLPQGLLHKYVIFAMKIKKL